MDCVFLPSSSELSRLSLGIKSIMLLRVASLLDTGAGPNLINESFLPNKWYDHIKSATPSNLRTANTETVNIDGMIPMLVRIGYLHAGA